MAYTSGIFYLDLVNGNDAARTTFAPTNYSNNGSGAVRVTFNAHGLVTGAVIAISGSGVAAYNDNWKITRIDANNFDLDTSTYSSNPATKGTVAPRGGSSWSDAWLTFGTGVTAARHQAGDTIRIAKSSDPTSIGNATWTSLSSTVTLASSQTLTLDNCETAWTAVNSATSGTSTNRKQGSLSVQVTMPSTGTAANTRYAYRTFGSTLDLSAYNAITFWYRPNALANNSTTWTLKLCSDTLGVTEVDRFDLPANNSASAWVPLTLTRVGGGNLGNSIQSIALYSGSTGPFNSNFTLLDNISVCTNTGLSLTSLISKNSAAFGGTDTWHNLQSIDGTTVTLGTTQSVTAGSNGLRGYYTTGTSPETVTTYIRPTIRFTPGVGSPGTLTRSGTAGNVITYSAGWDTATNTQNGESWLDGVNDNNDFFQNISNYSYMKFERFGMVRWSNPISVPSGTNTNWDVQMVTVGCGRAIQDYYTNSIFNLVTNNCFEGPTSGISTPMSKGNIYTSLISYNHGNSAGSLTTNSSYFQSIKIANCLGAFRMNTVGESTIDFISLYRSQNTSLVLEGYTNASPFATSYIIKELEYVNNNTGSNNGIVVSNAKIQKLTSSGNTGANGSMYNTQVLQTNATSSVLPTQITTAGYITFQPTISFNSVNNVVTDNRIYWTMGNALSQTTTRKTASGIAWQVNITNTQQSSLFPANIPIARIACNSGTAVTFKAWVLKSHATNIAAGLFIRALEIPGITSDIKTAKSDDTNWEELTISFTPTVAGVVQVYLQAWWVASTANQSVYIDDITVTQA